MFGLDRPGDDQSAAAATVPNGTFMPKHIKIVWVIKKGDPATEIGQFGFDPSAGVAPQGTTDQFQSEGLDGPDTDDPNPDDPADSASVSRRFRWVSTHKVTGVGLHFDLNINRVTKIGTVLVAKPCTAIDPLISNT